MSRNARRLARAHKLVGLVVGLQLLFWTASGLFFTLFPIEQIRGEHLRKESASMDAADLAGIVPPPLSGPVEQLELRVILGQPVWEAASESGSQLFDARSGSLLPAPDADAVRAIAEAAWAGDGAVTSVELVERPPREAFSGKPLWRVDFDGADRATFWVDPDTREVKAVRTGKWRLFDVLWRFHIMDVTGDDRFDSWWLKLFAFLGLTTVLFGIGLLVHRAMAGRLLR
ncbi:PepSY domain-containing protein [Henriciella mobilis]|uniref:PepSY domain-containing protein n=1 Tax=Henriciella mobilis TaxID=2305467 RepID=A0A399RRE3_9PROT|nr:PepSY domain-containing protein [Henriciella mobilis]RIJ32432.1 hypothetical protein D1223_00815 [Henriciella mobilis]